MKTANPIRPGALLASFVFAAAAFAQAPSRGSAAVYPVLFDSTGTQTSRAKAKEALYEVFQKGGFRVLPEAKAASEWKTGGYKKASFTRPPTARTLSSFGRAAGVRYVAAASVSFHTRSIWVNLGPRTISTCTMTVTIVDTKTGRVVYEADGDGRSDEKTDKVKVAAAILITPLVTAVSGGPKTPQESRAAQIAAADALNKFIVVDGGRKTAGPIDR